MRRVFLISIFILLFVSLYGAFVSVDEAKAIADYYALRWGEFSSGPVITLYSPDGRVFAYMFNYSYDGPFPSYSEILQRKKEIYSTIDNTDHDNVIKTMKEIWGEGKFSYVIISANTENQPVLEMANGLNRLFLIYDKIPQNSKIIYIAPYYFYADDGNDEGYINLFTLKREDVKFRETKNLNPDADKLQEKWNRVLNRKSFYPKSAEYAHVDGVPYYMWSYGCSPTSSAMIMGFYDPQGYGRLVKYYFDHYDVVVDGIVTNVPDIQQRLAIAMDTDTASSGGTSLSDIAPANESVPAEDGYSFDSYGYYGSSSDNWEWDRLKTELDAGKPVHWAILDYYLADYDEFIDGHSTVAVGYDISDDYADTFVIVHNTWDYYDHYWALHTYYNGTESWDYVYPITADGGSLEYNGCFDMPANVEVLQGCDNIFLLGEVSPLYDNIKVYTSTDEWATESELTGITWDGDYFVWNPSSSDTVRMRIEFYEGTNMLSADAIYGDVKISPYSSNYAVPEQCLYYRNNEIIEKYGNYLISGGSSGLYIYQISPYLYPLNVENREVSCMLIKGDTLIVGNANNTYLYDISSLPSLTLLDSLNIPSSEIKYDETDGIISFMYSSGVYLYDASDMSYLSDISVSYIRSAELNSNKLYTSSGIRSGILKVYDISDPTNISLIDSISTAIGSYLKVYGDYLYMCAALTGVLKYDITTYSVVDTLDTPGSATKIIFRQDNDAIVCDNSGGLRFIDPQTMEERGFYQYKNCYDAICEGDTIYIAEGTDVSQLSASAAYEESSHVPYSISISFSSNVVKLHSDRFVSGKIIIYDISGRKVYGSSLEFSGDKELKLNLINGVYFVRFDYNEGVLKKTITIVR